MIDVQPELYGGFQITINDGVLRTTTHDVLNPLDEIAGAIEYHREQRAALPPFVLPGEAVPHLKCKYARGAEAERDGGNGAIRSSHAQPSLFERENADAVVPPKAARSRPAGTPSVTRGAKWQR